MGRAESTALEALTAELLGDVGVLHDKVKALNEALPQAAETIRAAGQEAAASVGAAVDKAIANIPKEAGVVAPAASKSKVGLAMGGVALVSCLIGGTIGAAWFGKPATLTTEQTQQIAAGKDFLQLLGQLDQPTKERLIKMAEKNHQ